MYFSTSLSDSYCLNYLPVMVNHALYIAVFLALYVHASFGQQCTDTERECGCANGGCWKYAGTEVHVGAPWCYTQILGMSPGFRAFQSCTSDAECFMQMTCGSNSRYSGHDQQRSAEDKLPPVLPNDPNSQRWRCNDTNRVEPNPVCGCHEGGCWKYAGQNYQPGVGSLCFTQALGVVPPSKQYQTCQSDSDCAMQMTCGSAHRYVGSQLSSRNEATDSAIEAHLITTCSGVLASSMISIKLALCSVLFLCFFN